MTTPFTYDHYIQDLAHLYAAALHHENLPLAVKIAQLRFTAADQEADRQRTTVTDIFACIQAMSPEQLLQLCTMMESLMGPFPERSDPLSAATKASGVGVAG